LGDVVEPDLLELFLKIFQSPKHRDKAYFPIEISEILSHESGLTASEGEVEESLEGLLNTDFSKNFLYGVIGRSLVMVDNKYLYASTCKVLESRIRLVLSNAAYNAQVKVLGKYRCLSTVTLNCPPTRLISHFHVVRLWQMLQYLGLQAKCTLLDAGCGNGWVTSELGVRSGKVVALDISLQSLNENMNFCKVKVTSDLRKNIHHIQGDLRNMPIRDNVFDRVVCSEVLEHMPYEKPAVKELYGVLKEGGTAVFTVPMKFHLSALAMRFLKKSFALVGFKEKTKTPRSDFTFDTSRLKFHFREYSKAQITNLLKECSFEVVHIRDIGFTFPFAEKVYGWMTKLHALVAQAFASVLADLGNKINYLSVFEVLKCLK